MGEGTARRVRLLLGLALAAGLAAGCGGPQAAVRYAAGRPDETVAYDTATYQFARERKVQIILYRRTAAPIGEADPDFEYVCLEIPDRAKYGWVREDHVPAHRWVRQYGRNTVWQGTTGQATLRFSDDRHHLHLDFRMAMEPLGAGEGGGHILSGRIKCLEDAARTQGLVNRYGEWLRSLLQPPPTPGKMP